MPRNKNKRGFIRECDFIEQILKDKAGAKSYRETCSGNTVKIEIEKYHRDELLEIEITIDLKLYNNLIKRKEYHG